MEVQASEDTHDGLYGSRHSTTKKRKSRRPAPSASTKRQRSSNALQILADRLRSPELPISPLPPTTNTLQGQVTLQPSNDATAKEAATPLEHFQTPAPAIMSGDKIIPAAPGASDVATAATPPKLLATKEEADTDRLSASKATPEHGVSILSGNPTNHDVINLEYEAQMRQRDIGHHRTQLVEAQRSNKDAIERLSRIPERKAQAERAHNNSFNALEYQLKRDTDRAKQVYDEAVDAAQAACKEASTHAVAEHNAVIEGISDDAAKEQKIIELSAKHIRRHKRGLDELQQ